MALLLVRFVVAAAAKTQAGGMCPMNGSVVVKDAAAGSDCRLNYYAAGVVHPNGCAFHGKWNNSCDVFAAPETGGSDLFPQIRQVGGWTEECDPYGCYNEKTGKWTGGDLVTGLCPYDSNPIKWTGDRIGQTDGEFVDKTTGKVMSNWTSKDESAHGGPDWVCPVEERSPSGCGDFRTDTREPDGSPAKCAADKIQRFDKEQDGESVACSTFFPDGQDRHVITLPEPTLPQKHTCVQRPIFYEDGNTDAEGRVLPRTLGKHRPRWAAWGEYNFLPPQRWMHNAEHGTLVFLYHQCLSEEDLCKMRQFIVKLHKKGVILGVDPEKAPLRFIMTPFKDLLSPMAILTWGEMYFSKCWNEENMLKFARDNYRMGWEDWYPDGMYTHLLNASHGEKFVEATEGTCGADPTSGKNCKSDEDCGFLCTCGRPGAERRDLLFASGGFKCAC